MKLLAKHKAILYMLFSALGFSLMAVFIKLMGDLPVLQKSIFRSTVIGIFSIGVLIATRTPFSINARQFRFLVLRSAFGTFGVILNYYAIDHLILSDANVLNRLSTVFMLIFSWIFLKEMISKAQFFSIIIAFVGVIFIVRPEFSFDLIPYTVALGGAAFAALAYTTLRYLGKDTNPSVVVCFFSVFMTIVLMPYVLLHFAPMSLLQVVYGILAGASALVGQYGVTFAYKYAPAREVSIYNYFGVIFSALLGMILFGELPTLLSLIGYIIIFVSAFYLFKVNNKENKGA